jgi:Streptomyces sporulation and cell division protein, SsgA
MRNGSPSAALILDLTAMLVLLDGQDLPIGVQLTYDVADPYALQAHFADPSGEVVTWIFARDLLADGLRSMIPVGSGAIQVQATSVLTEISHLTDDDGIEMLRLPWWNTREFIRLTHTVVPRGHEDIDIDSWLDDLTAS